MRINKSVLPYLCICSLAWITVAFAGPRAIDTQKSVMTVKVFRGGVLSVFGHDHDVSAPIASGVVDTSNRQVELHVKSSALLVVDKSGSSKDRDKIQKTMVGPEVLDTRRYEEIHFKSTHAEPQPANGWRVHGNLTLHGQTRPVTVEVQEKAGHFVGHVLLNQTEFGIKPVRVAGGAVRVKDKVRIEFDLQLAP